MPSTVPVTFAITTQPPAGIEVPDAIVMVVPPVDADAPVQRGNGSAVTLSMAGLPIVKAPGV